MDRPEEWKGRWKEFFLGVGRFIWSSAAAGLFLAAGGEIRRQLHRIDITATFSAWPGGKIVPGYEAAGRPVDNLALLSHDIGRIDLMMDENDRVERIYIHFAIPGLGAPPEAQTDHPGMLARYAAFLPVGGSLLQNG